MADTAHHAPQAQALLDAHVKSVEDLHQKLSNLPEFSSEKAQSALHASAKAYREATQTFHDDVLGSVSNI